MRRFFTIIKSSIALLCFLVLSGHLFSLDAQAEGSYSFSVIDQEMTGSITVEQCVFDYESGYQPLRAAGVEYQITYLTRLDQTEVKAQDADFFQTTKTTGEDGIVIFEDLALGTYRLEVTGGMPEGYRVGNPFQVSVPALNESEVTYDGVTYDPGMIWEYDVKARPKSEPEWGAVRLIKYDSRTGESLEGAVFVLYDENGEICHTVSGKDVELTTDEQGRIEVYRLAYGNYYFQEVEAPEGYEKSDEKVEFRITKSYVEGDESTIELVTMGNKAIEESDEPSTEPGNPNKPENPKEPEDPNKPQDSTSNPNTPPKREVINPLLAIKTGDTTQIGIWVGVLVVAAAALICLRKKERRRKRE